MKSKLAFKPEAIIKTIGKDVIRDIGGMDTFIKSIESISEGGFVWFLKIGAVPKYEVLYCYLVVDNKIMYRANICKIQEIQEGASMVFPGPNGTNRIVKGRFWLMLTGPIIKPEEDIEMRGFQGFRYSEMIF